MVQWFNGSNRKAEGPDKKKTQTREQGVKLHIRGRWRCSFKVKVNVEV